MKEKLITSAAMQEWYTAAALAAGRLPGLPATERAIQLLAKRQDWYKRRTVTGTPLARRRKERGGGWEFHYTILPDRAQAALVARHRKVAEAVEAPCGPSPTSGHREIWDWYERQPDRKKDKARAKLAAIQAVTRVRRCLRALKKAIRGPTTFRKSSRGIARDA